MFLLSISNFYIIFSFSSELGITEHIEGDECKFAVWTGRAPIFDYRLVLRANSIETKQTWVRKLREVIQETYFSSSTLNLMKSPGKATAGGNKNVGARLSKETATVTEEIPLNEPDQDGHSLTSFGSGNTTDSEKVSGIFTMHKIYFDAVCVRIYFRCNKI